MRSGSIKTSHRVQTFCGINSTSINTGGALQEKYTTSTPVCYPEGKEKPGTSPLTLSTSHFLLLFILISSTSTAEYMFVSVKTGSQGECDAALWRWLEVCLDEEHVAYIPAARPMGSFSPSPSPAECRCHCSCLKHEQLAAVLVACCYRFHTVCLGCLKH